MFARKSAQRSNKRAGIQPRKIANNEYHMSITLSWKKVQVINFLLINIDNIVWSIYE